MADTLSKKSIGNRIGSPTKTDIDILYEKIDTLNLNLILKIDEDKMELKNSMSEVIKTQYDMLDVISSRINDMFQIMRTFENRVSNNHKNLVDTVNANHLVLSDVFSKNEEYISVLQTAISKISDKQDTILKTVTSQLNDLRQLINSIESSVNDMHIILNSTADANHLMWGDVIKICSKTSRAILEIKNDFENVVSLMEATTAVLKLIWTDTLFDSLNSIPAKKKKIKG